MTITQMDRSLIQKITGHQAIICVIGLGRVGLPLAVIFANKGSHVIGVDNDKPRLDSIKNSNLCKYLKMKWDYLRYWFRF